MSLLVDRVQARSDSICQFTGNGRYPGADSMSRINDVGGMHGFGVIPTDLDGPPFHADWEAHVYALNRALLGRGLYNLDEFRDAIERMAPAAYLAASYYERWLAAIVTLLEEKNVLSATELADVHVPQR
ncbi:MAG: hypothetical protein NVSMB22_10290 [Chloroflexota bacterium]